MTNKTASQILKSKLDLNNEEDIQTMFDLDSDELYVDYKGNDPLLISSIQYRIYKGNQNRIVMTLTSKQLIDLYKQATDEDYQLVEDIKTYYTSKYMIRELQTNTLTSYKTNVLNLFNMSKEGFKKVPDKWIGIAYKLPFFYEHDIKLDRMFEQHQNSLFPMPEFGLKLTYIQKLVPSSKKFPDNHYWFKDDYGNMYLFKGKTPNPLLTFFERFLEENKVIKLGENPRILAKTYFNHSYYELAIPDFQYV